MQIKAEYVNPSDNSRVVLLKEEIDIISFSKILEKSFNINSKTEKGSWNGIVIIYYVDNATIRIDDIYEGDLRILVNSNDLFYINFINKIKAINEYSKNN